MTISFCPVCGFSGIYIPPPDEKSKMIPITQKQPPKNKPFLAFNEGKFFVAEWLGVEWLPKGYSPYYRSSICDCCETHDYGNITHWMELPEPPEAEEKNP